MENAPFKYVCNSEVDIISCTHCNQSYNASVLDIRIDTKHLSHSGGQQHTFHSNHIIVQTICICGSYMIEYGGSAS